MSTDNVIDMLPESIFLVLKLLRSQGNKFPGTCEALENELVRALCYQTFSFLF